MDRLLYVAMSGARGIMDIQAVQAQNLANANTVGFRKDLHTFSALPVRGPGYADRVYTGAEAVEADLSAGAVISTGRQLDVAVNGEGWIAVQAPDGTEAYSRAGDLRIDANGLLTTGAGLPVLGNAGPIAIPPYESLDIGVDGTITVRAKGQGANALAQLDRIKLVNAVDTELRKGADGLIRTQSGAPLGPDAGVQLTVGSLESSNVNGVEAMVTMIELARQFELHMKVMKAAENNDEASQRLMRLGS